MYTEPCLALAYGRKARYYQATPPPYLTVGAYRLRYRDDEWYYNLYQAIAHALRRSLAEPQHRTIRIIPELLRQSTTVQYYSTALWNGDTEWYYTLYQAIAHALRSSLAEPCAECGLHE
eukprot:1353563-Rhodomonas_salina.1